MGLVIVEVRGNPEVRTILSAKQERLLAREEYRLNKLHNMNRRIRNFREELHTGPERERNTGKGDFRKRVKSWKEHRNTQHHE
jgi:hypothetical protein